MLGGRMLTWLLAGAMLVGCSRVVDPNPRVEAPANEANPPKSNVLACGDPARAGEGERFLDAVFIQNGALFGVDLKSGAVREVIRHQGDTDFETESAIFSRSGDALLVHRNKEGRDSWWSAAADGSEPKRLQLPVDRQVRQALPVCSEEFVGVLSDGRFLRFDLTGEQEYWQPAAEDAPLIDKHAVVSPAGDAVAYVARSGIVVLGLQGKGLTMAGRMPGKEIFGWLGHKAVVTGDTTAVYVLDISKGTFRKADYSSLLGKAPRIISVSVHPQGDFLYVVDRSSIPQAGNTVMAIDASSLKALSALPHRIPPTSKGAPGFSPLGGFEAWPVDQAQDIAYEAPVALIKTATGEIVRVTDAKMASVPFAFHPGDDGFVFTDISRDGKYLVYQDGAGRRTDLAKSVEGHLFEKYQWNPQLGGSTKR